jgi:betaine/carnitine transporter, BCCT family
VVVKKLNQKNKKSMDLSITLPAIILVGAFSLIFALFTDESTEQLQSIFDFVVDQFRWGYIWYGALITIAAIYFSFSKYGQVVLGNPTDKPRFTLFEYSSILVSMGLGATIMRTGMVQWAEVANDPPFGLEPGSTDAILAGNSYSMFCGAFRHLLFS